jgi:hypothetical protein
MANSNQFNLTGEGISIKKNHQKLKYLVVCLAYNPVYT